MEMQPRNEENAEIWKGSNGKVRKYHEEQRCVIRDQVEIIHTLVFPVATYRCRSCTMKKADRKKVDLFKIWC